MKWVTSKEEFEKMFLIARTCVHVDSGRQTTTLHRLVFDDAQLVTIEFCQLVRNLMRWSNTKNSYYVVLDHDPIYYFHRAFGKYPMLEMSGTDSDEDYLIAMNEDPGGSPADAVGNNWLQSVMFDPSLHWFIFPQREAPRRTRSGLVLARSASTDVLVFRS
jgi:hypothetical protein